MNKHCQVTGLPLVGTGACDCGACDDLTDAENYGSDEDASES